MEFSELRVLDFCWVGAGAFVTRLLADMGAQVIKVESHVHPDNLRLSGPHKPGAKALEASGYFASRNTGKKSLALNMRRPEARELALKLAAHCAVVTNNFRPGVMDNWGLSYARIAAINPSVVYLAMPMQGSTGPNRNFMGFGSTISALAGLVDASGLPDRPPIGTGTHYPDHIPNPGHALLGLLAAVYHRALTGKGQQVELAQLESTVNLLGPSLLKCSAGGGPPRRNGNRRPNSVPAGVFRCAGDDVWCAIEVVDDRAWHGLLTVLGGPGWAKEGWGTLLGRTAEIDEIEARVAAATRLRDAGELVAELQGQGVPASVVATSRDVAEDPQLNARGYWRHVEHAEMGQLLANTPPFAFVETARRDPSPPPLLGEHTVEIATSLLGMSEAECRRLMDEEILY